jgi:hypothetical protein
MMSRLAIRWDRDLKPVGPYHRPDAHLLGTLVIAGVPHHVEAFEVEERDGAQESVLPDHETSLSELSDMAPGAHADRDHRGPPLRDARHPVPGLNLVPTRAARCVECRQPARGTHRCPDCRHPVHQRCHGGHACPPRQARLAALTAAMQARLVAYRVVLTLQVDSARGSPQTWDWPTCLGLHPPERVAVDAVLGLQALGDLKGSEG